MSWKSARLVLIITYSIIAVLFAALLVFFGIRCYILDVNGEATAKKVLADNGILISQDLELKQDRKSCSFSLKNASYDVESLALRLLGEGYFKIDNNQFKSSKRQLRITGSRILYENTREREKIKGSVDVERQILDFLDNLGFSTNKCAIYNTNLSNGIITFEAMPKIMNYWIHGTGFKASADKNGIFYLEGTWFEPTKENAEKITFCKEISAIVNFIHAEDVKGKTIDKIYANFYVTEEDSLNNYVIPMPMYVIKCTDGSEYKFNARNAMLAETK